ncbi:MAG: sigma-70 family RNA polymerase sigma factor [Planctomycetes bacterium]|nr:sigma-70 family RNA polymerase sigma factor [Planctomycetota bacterium]
MNEQREDEIVRGLRQGEPAAWHALYDAYAPAIWSAVARRLGPCSADVADVVQETFLAAARTARNFDSAQGTLWSWLSGIARHHVAQHFRKEQRQTRIVQAAAALGSRHDEVQAWLERPAAGPLDALVTAEMALLIRATLASLSGDYEDLLARKYLDGVSVEQMADERATSETAVRSRLARARKAFRQAFTARISSRGPTS